MAGHSSSDAPKYGRGRLNYPLPDFSKVEPRVRFPRHESYHPPKARSRSKQPQDPGRPLIFKSPAEIVQEVLLSSEEACSGKNPPPTHPFTGVPQEFQTPEQATKLVHQLQVSQSHFYEHVTKAHAGLGGLEAGKDGGPWARAGSPCWWREGCTPSHEDRPKPFAQREK